LDIGSGIRSPDIFLLKNSRPKIFQTMNMSILNWIPSTNFPDFRRRRQIGGYKCTIPYKQQVMQFLDEIDPEAKQIARRKYH
jgi:hypothetical protein